MLLAALVTALSSKVSAAVVVWGTPTSSSVPGDVLTTGTFVVAESAADSALTVNGVTFAQNGTANDLSFTYQGNFHFTGGTTPPASVADSAYNTLLTWTNYTTTGFSGGGIITLSNLIMGDTYRVQIWTPFTDITYPTTLSAGNSVDMGNSAGVSRWVIGTFTADSATQTIAYNPSPTYAADSMAAVALYDITAIPEPAEYAAALGAVGLGLALAARRKKTL